MTTLHVAPALLQAVDPNNDPVTGGAFFWFTVLKMLIIFTIYMVGVAMLTLAERKISAWIQDRHGPNRVGKGWLQPAADGLKNFMKEETMPAGVNRPLFVLAPMLSFLPALTAWCVIPFGAPIATRWGRVDLVVADLPVGFLFILAITSLGVYGIVLAGWSSNNKYALLGGLRSSAQMVSYEISMGMSTIPVLLLAGNVTLNSIINQQAWGGWNVVNLTVAFFIFMVAAFAETNRLPFDLPEAESELIAGYHTEYSAMKFSLFFIAEYASMVTASALMATLFFGGWDVPFTAHDNIGPYSGWLSLLSIVIFLAKILFFLFFFMWVRWTLPRFRYDQLMSLGWKVLLPLALVYIVLIAAVILGLSAAGIEDARLKAAIFGSINVALIIILFAIFDRGRVISPAYGRMPAQEIEKLRRIDRRRRVAAEVAK
ncbi:MAG TPA: NADH-quinone oxidoreductase subunit NuoH [Gemmatimonadaceae bacterium]|nr:NADH-quinone oxidoreductase subunit NuoH [Gemmatimonadaceae bacterium]HZF74040.1 NADH-quinone oxidoreductase subunit NuoH [Gemmatimonadaceae bacterium]